VKKTRKTGIESLGSDSIKTEALDCRIAFTICASALIVAGAVFGF
jgi:hypothetical protein